MTAPDKPRRSVSDEERTLWRDVTRTIKPLKRRGPRAVEPAEDDAPKAAKAKSPAPTRPSQAPTAAAVARPAPQPKEPGPAPLDRRARQKLARGTQPIDARLDLHGRTQSEAHVALLRFLRRAQDDGAKTVLVITGKGGAADSGRGVLKRQVPLWLSLPEFRALVIDSGAASIRHGGDGALYVRIKRAR